MSQLPTAPSAPVLLVQAPEGPLSLSLSLSLIPLGARLSRGIAVAIVLLNSPPNPGEFGVGRFRAAVFTSDCGRRGQGGADVLRIKPGHLLLYPAAKKKQKNTAQMHLSPRPRAIPVPKASTPKRRGRLAAHLRGQRSWRNPGLMYSGHCKNSGD